MRRVGVGRAVRRRVALSRMVALLTLGDYVLVAEFSQANGCGLFVCLLIRERVLRKVVAMR